MAYIVKQNAPQQVVINQDRFELFSPIVMKNAQDEDVEVLQSIGTFSVTELQQRKDYLLAEIAEIDNKLTAISNIQNPA